MGPSILVDDSNLITNFNYLGGQWSLQTGESSVLNGTLTTGTPAPKSNIIPSQLFFSFWGSGINFYGNMTSGVAANYTVDETTLRPIPFPTGISSGKTGINLFSLLNLTEGLTHNINIYPTAGQFALDYITYVPNSDTTLTAANLILDDADPELQYGNGQWNHTTGDFQQGRPYNGTMTGTNTKGATMQFTFEGSSITVNGVLNRVDGRLSASFVVDGQNSSSSTFTPFNGNQEDTDSSRWMLSQQFFHQDLTPGQHTVVMTLEDVSGPQMLWIDSVVFEGTSLTTLSPIGSGSGSGFGSTPGSSSFSFPKAAIGGIAAALFFLALACWGYARRRRQNNRTAIVVEETVYIPPPGPPPPPVAIHSHTQYNSYEIFAPAAAQYAAPASLHIPRNPPAPPSAPQQQRQYRDQPSGLQPPTAIPTPEQAGSDGSYYAPPSSAGTPSTQRGDSYYTYSGGKADVVGLEWGEKVDSDVGDGAAAPGMPLPQVPYTQPNSVLQGNIGRRGGNLPAHSDGSNPSRAAAAQVGSDAHNPQPSNHAYEDGRDDGPIEEQPGSVSAEPQRERDGGPTDFPPAYDDGLYGR